VQSVNRGCITISVWCESLLGAKSALILRLTNSNAILNTQQIAKDAMMSRLERKSPDFLALQFQPLTELHLRKNYPPSQKAANSSWRMNAERVSTGAVLAMRRIAAFIANMISAGGCASAGFAEAGALVPPTPVGGAPPEVVKYM
jgi:hypothetical protein